MSILVVAEEGNAKAADLLSMSVLDVLEPEEAKLQQKRPLRPTATLMNRSEWKSDPSGSVK
jgi:hypothetical protein